MKIGILLGSVRKDRQSFKVGLHLEEQIIARGFEADLIDLAEDPLPIFSDPKISGDDLQERIQELGSRLESADALIFLTPEYHGSFSGVLKNALDHFWVEFARKPIGVAAVSSGKFGGINASTQLQHVILSLGAYPLPLKLLISNVENAFDVNLKPNEHVTKSTEKFLEEYFWFSEIIAQAKKSKTLT